MADREVSRRSAPAAVHPAVRAARQVVGLYGDPDVTWCILLELELAEARAAHLLSARLADIVEDYPHLGLRPTVETLALSGSRIDPVARQRFANRPFGAQEPLVRTGLSPDGLHVLVAAHHGVVDGLGLLGLTGLLLDLPLGTGARGVARTGAEPGFFRGSLARLHEVLLRPPERFRASRRGPAAAGDILVHRDLSPLRRGTGALAWAALLTLRGWNGPETRRRQPVIALGVSRRPGTPPIQPIRDTAYTRLPVVGVTSFVDLAARLVRSEPEPDFPVSDAGGLGPVLIRLLASRLGASLLVSNLGLVDDPRVRAVRFWPVASGPAGVAFGLASTRQTTTVTVRVRNRWFDRSDADRLLDLGAEALVQLPEHLLSGAQ